jgi:hypothetical protein
MSTITANPVVEALLGGLGEPTEIRGASGHLLGYFTPTACRQALYDEANAHFDPAEMKRRKDMRDAGSTTAEILEHLQSLGSA